MSTLPVIVVGAGGHALVVADALLAGGHQVLGFVDPDTTKAGTPMLGLPVFGSDAELHRFTPDAVVLANGIGGVGDGGRNGGDERKGVAADGLHDGKRRLRVAGAA